MAITLIIRIVFLLFRITVSSARHSTPNQEVSLRPTPTPTFFVARAAPTQHRANSSAAFFLARAKRARRASRCQRHLPLKMHLAVDFYYLVTSNVSFRSMLSPNPQVV